MKEKRRPTLEELKSLPALMWQLEMSQIATDACLAGQFDIELVAMSFLLDPDLTPEKIVELREKLQRATGSTEEQTAAEDAA